MSIARSSALIFALGFAALAAVASPARAARSVEVDDLEQAMRQAIDRVAPSVVQVIVPEMTEAQIEEAKRRERLRRLRELAREAAEAERAVPADEAPPQEPAEAAEDVAPQEAPSEAPEANEAPAAGEGNGDESPEPEIDEDIGRAVRTGLVISAQGHVVTSLVNVGKQTEGIVVRLADGRELPAARLGEDIRRDLVLLKVEATDLPVPEFVPKDETAIGQWALALGRALPVDQVTVSKGIVSALGRMAGVAIQTDADVSPMNYGGPLVDIEGRVIAVIASVGRAGSTERAEQFSDSGIGFAIAAQDILAELEDLKAGKRLEVPFLGVQFNMFRVGRGAKVEFVYSTTAAKAAGLEAGDIILSVNGDAITSPFQLMHRVGDHRVGDTITLEVQRDERTLTLQATLRARPEHLPRR